MITIHAQRTNWGQQIELAIISGPIDQPNVAVVKALEFEALEVGMPVRPSLSLQPTAAQQLMDQLWTCDLRPSEGTGSAGAMAATERHLADMQKAYHALLKGLEVQVAP